MIDQHYIDEWLTARPSTERRGLRLLPHQDRVLVEVDDDATHECDGLIEVPEAHRRFSRTGTVRAVGLGRPGKKGAWIPTTVQVGERVLLPFAGTDTHVYNIAGRECRILHEDELLGVVD